MFTDQVFSPPPGVSTTLVPGFRPTVRDSFPAPHSRGSATRGLFFLDSLNLFATVKVGVSEESGYVIRGSDCEGVFDFRSQGLRACR